MILNIIVAEDNKSFMIDFAEQEMVVVGRGIKEGTIDAPYIDLSEYNARKLGVSRIHAIFRRHEDNIFLEDQNSANGTFLNGVRLFPQQPRVMRDRDRIHLGRLGLTVRIAYAKHPHSDLITTTPQLPLDDVLPDEIDLPDDPDPENDIADKLVETGNIG
ncbi:MAG: FHA domain-containing protein [Chloroflexi bacterium]|nr:MAG: FHA domain-containing protein [Chloroflexota bacterium]